MRWTLLLVFALGVGHALLCLSDYPLTATALNWLLTRLMED